MAKESAAIGVSASDGMDGFIPLGGSLLDAEISSSGSESFGETPYGNSELEEVTGDPDDEELLDDGEEVDDDEAEGEDDGVELPETVDAKKSSDSYWQSKYDKLTAETERLQRLAGYEGVIARLQEDPEAAKLLMEHWTRPAPAPAKEPELVEPEPPDDFDMNMIGVRGSSSHQYWKEQQTYHREVARREARDEARRATEEVTRPIAQERAMAKHREQIAAALSKTDLPIDEYDSFAKWVPPVEALARVYMEGKGVTANTKAKVSEKAKEFAKVKENSEKAGAVKKVKGESSTIVSGDDSFMASLKAATSGFRYKS